MNLARARFDISDKMESKPYIGITGPATVDEVTVVGNLFREAGYSNQSIHVPMIGILVSHKTLERQPTKNRRYPNYQLVPELFAMVLSSLLGVVYGPVSA